MRSVQKIMVGIFSVWNEQLVNNSFIVSFRKVFGTLMKYQFRPNFLRIKHKTLELMGLSSEIPRVPPGIGWGIYHFGLSQG